MAKFSYYSCPQCGKKHDDSGKLGSSRRCHCGAWIVHSKLDVVRYYWILQTSNAFGGAVFFFALGLFFKELPNDPWDRLLSPLVQVPTLLTILISFIILVKHKLSDDNSAIMLRYFKNATELMIIGFVSLLIISILDKKNH